MTDPDDDGLDRRLREHASRWRESLPTPAESLSLADPPRRRAALMVPAAAVAIVALALVGVWALGPRGGAERTPTGPITGSPAGVVPWADLPTTDPELATTGQDPSPAEVKTAAPCVDGDLTVLRRDLEPAMGTAYLTVQLALQGSTPCRIEGYPDVALLDPSGDVLDVPVEHDTASPGDPVLVTPTEPAAVVVSWSPSHYCDPLDNARIRIGIPDSAGDVTVDGFGPTSCNPGEGTPSPRVRPVQPAYADDGPTSPYEQVTATGDLNLSVDVGAPIDFEVTLTSPVDLPLDPCPDYEILVAPRIDYHGLNCAAVPYVDEKGQPYLPAGVPVTFAMHAAGFDTTVLITKFAWVLTAPGHPTVGGWVEIGDAAPPEATVTGFVTMDGGPAPGTSTKVTEGTVHARGLVDRTATIVAGQFEMQLPAGRYDLWATSPDYGDGTADCHPTDLPDGLVVKPGQMVQVAISCQMR